ncbi:ribosomal protein L11 methyltransferase [Lewinella marina]|uniref:Ribosomal protein L11 methyltransferase n=1 Tax=Neolewinella marina TaxID=438751 RepID=A0A2G0CHT8_9BACT|nr:50S ribosomal protein L11 methyltransferase [Neolewinella marina]NJB85390.1 ribosomal protein L11 methyltransferase [Neolewinella marina]PHK99497.1 50S ribosomal protein L11 methyltransferase [Neolewinella marina]
MYTVYQIGCSADLTDILIARLADAGFDSFLEEEDGLLAYGTSDRHPEWIRVLDELREAYTFDYSCEVLEEKNWNEVWESGFSPIRVGDRLLIRASFHPHDPEVRHELVIDPRMAFGTGHHATTYMMCELLMDHYAAGGAGESVLDYGCGTGVLAILAKRLGARVVDAVDIEAPAVENTIENAKTNGVELAEIVEGTLDDVPERQPYDLVLANINRNVLLETGAALKMRLRSGGTAFLSGILEQDEDLIRQHFTDLGFELRRREAREGWRAFEFKR